MNDPSERWWRGLQERQDEERAAAGYLSRARALRGRRPLVAMPVRWWWPALGAAAVLAGAIVWNRSARSDLRFSMGGEAGHVGSWIAAPEASTLALDFSDGTRFRLSAGSRARVSAVDANGARIVVERGSARAAVVHRPESHWLVDVGPFEVSVVGTRFDVSWDPVDEVFRLELEEGSVLVSGACLSDPRAVVQGHALRVSCRRDGEEIVETGGELTRAQSAGSGDLLAASPDIGVDTPVAAAAPADAGRVVSAEPARPVEGSRRAASAEGVRAGDVLRSRAWRALTSAGRFREALDLVEEGGFDETCRRAAGADLLELGDASRLAGDSRRARQAYLAARGKLPGGGRSAYSLGLAAFDQDKEFAVAARWFDVYLSEQPAGSLRREAQGRLMEAWLRAGDRPRARTVAERYLQEYPDGTQAPLARQIAAP
jgi:transmembrane sensor